MTAAPNQITAANAGGASVLYPEVSGPAWLRSALGVSLAVNVVEKSQFTMRRRMAWSLFAAGMVLQPLAWIVWMIRVGPEWWTADGTPLGMSAAHTKGAMFTIGVGLCLIAPFLSLSSFRRSLCFSVAGAVAAFVLGYLSSLLVLFIYGV